MVGGVELRDSGTLLATAAGRTAVVALCKPEDRAFVLGAAHDALDTARSSGVDVDPVTVRERAADESEWRDVWKQFFRATRVGRRFTVRPSWDPGGPAPPLADSRAEPAGFAGSAASREGLGTLPGFPSRSQFVIDLDPGRAFGTGAHPSTRLVIGLAEDWQAGHPGVARFLDLGCGSGILSIAAARLWPAAQGLAIDNDPEAVACCDENLARNQVATVTSLVGSIERADGSFGVVLANIQADVLCELAAELAAKVAPDGCAILSGILLEQVDDVLSSYARAGLVLDRRRDEGEWGGLCLRPRSVQR